MTLLDRYIVREFLDVFLPTLLGFVLLYFVVDLFDRLDILLRHEATVYSAAKYFAYKIPLMVTQVIPPAVLVSCLISLGVLGRHNEITAMRAAGVSLARTARPLLLTAAAISVLALAWDEGVVPYCARQFQWVNNVEIRKRAPRAIFSERDIWYRGAQGIYNIAHVDQDRGKLFGLTVYRIDSDFALRTILEIPVATWEGDHWQARDGIEHIVLPSGDLQSRPLGSDVPVITERLTDFSEVRREPEELSYLELRDRIRQLSEQGIDPSNDLVDLQMKLAVPFASLVLAWVGIPLAGRVKRHPSIAATLGAGLFAGAGYWLILAFGKSLGDTLVIPAIAAAWAANTIYLLLGGALFLGSE
jgi:lipopolysaccharide export system permease protein